MIDIDSIQIYPSWKEVLREEFQKPYFAQIKHFLIQEKEAGHIVYPKGVDIFNAFNQTHFDQVKVVIIGQDPYHGEGEAHGLCFSVQDGVKQPPSLKNIFKELKDDLDTDSPVSGNLTKRAQQGVFLLNASLTVRKDSPNSHKDIGWQIFTDAVIHLLSEKKEWLVFILRGAYAQSKQSLIGINRHTILMSPHPSPFSVHKWFYGSKPFSKTNQILRDQGKEIIDWKL